VGTGLLVELFDEFDRAEFLAADGDRFAILELDVDEFGVLAGGVVRPEVDVVLRNRRGSSSSEPSMERLQRFVSMGSGRRRRPRRGGPSPGRTRSPTRG